jgi:hypothetical protein
LPAPAGAEMSVSLPSALRGARARRLWVGSSVRKRFATPGQAPANLTVDLSSARLNLDESAA